MLITHTLNHRNQSRLSTLKAALLITSFSLAACGSDMDFSGSGAGLVNENFSGNKIELVEGMNGCLNLTQADLANLYDTSVNEATVVDLAKENVGNVDPRTPPNCTLRIQMSDDKWDFLTGGIVLNREVSADEYMGDLAEARGDGENWQEAWELNQQIRALESIPNLGMAALWNAKTRQLSIKFDGYSALIQAPGAAFNEVEKARNRDYKQIAVSVAQLSGLSDQLTVRY